MTLAPLTKRPLTPAMPWRRDPLWTRARMMPSFDIDANFSATPVDRISGLDLTTHTRAASATYIDSDGLLKTAPTNLLLRSEEFDNASWTKTNASVISNSITAPTGFLTGDTLVRSGTSLAIVASADLTPGAVLLTCSVYAKAGTQNFLVIQVNIDNAASASFITFNLTNGAVGTRQDIIGSVALTATAVSAGDGWYRCSVTFTGGATNSGVRYGAASAANTRNGVDGGTIYIWGAQLEVGSTATAYLATGASPRSALRRQWDATNQRWGWLVEEARTNSIRNNTMVGAVAGTPGTLPTNWAFGIAGSGLTREIVGTGTENGINYIDVKISGTSGGTSAIAFGIDRGTAATGQTWTGSAYFKLVGGSTSGVTDWQIGLIEETSGTAFVAGAYYSVGTPSSTLSRVSATRTLSGGATVGLLLMRIDVTCTNGAAINFTLRIGLPQLEQGAFATSPILTSGSTATRDADVWTVTGTNFSRWFTSTRGTIAADFVSGVQGSATTSVQSFGVWGVHNAGLGSFNGYGLRAVLNLNNAGNISASSRYAPAAQNDVINLGVNAYINLGQRNTVSFAWDSSGIAGAYNGGVVSPGSNAAFSNNSGADTLLIGSQNIGGAGPYSLNGTISRLTYFPARLSNPTLQELTKADSSRDFGDPLWNAAGSVPSFDIDASRSGTPVDRISGLDLTTHTRAASATYIDSDGLLKTAPTNLLLRSEEFDNASWNKARCSVTQNVIAAPNGTITADLLIEDTSLNTHRLLATAATVAANSTVTFSVYFKSKERTQIQLNVDEATGAGGAAFSAFYSASGVSNGQATGGATYTSGSVQALGDGWYRAVIIGTLAGGYTSYRCSIFPAVSGSISYQGDGTSGIYIWGAQLEVGSTPTAYLATGASPRSALRRQWDATNQRWGWLVEEARTNLFVRSEEIDNASWSKVRSSATLNLATSPAGTLTGDRLTEDSSASNTHFARQDAAVTSGVTYTLTVFAKADTRSQVALGFGADNGCFPSGDSGLFTLTGSGTATALTGSPAATIRSIGDGWYRCSVTQTAAATATGVFRVFLAASGTATYTGDGTSGLFLWGAQLEAGAFPTSYIPTGAATATRDADVWTVTGTNFSRWYNATEGTLLCVYRKSADVTSTRTVAAVSDGGFLNRMTMRSDSASAHTNFVAVAGSVVAAFAHTGLSSTLYKVALAYRQDNFGSAANGNALADDTSGSLPVVDRLSIGSVNNAEICCSTLERIVFWPPRLTTSTLQELTR